jgi:hypothetical protein
VRVGRKVPVGSPRLARTPGQAALRGRVQRALRLERLVRGILSGLTSLPLDCPVYLELRQLGQEYARVPALACEQFLLMLSQRTRGLFMT